MLVLVAVSAAVAAGPGGNVGSLQSHASVLDARAHHALLDLYALDTRLESAQTALASLEAQASRLRGQQALLSQYVAATRLTLVVSQRRLGDNLRTLYEQGDTDPLAVMLGAQSLDDAITRLDDLTRVADQSRQVVAVTSAAQLRLARARTTLARRRAQLDVALAAARRTASDLVAARGRRLAFISQLRNEQRLTNRQISTLQLAAQQVEASRRSCRAPPTPPPAATPADLVVTGRAPRRPRNWGAAARSP